MKILKKSIGIVLGLLSLAVYNDVSAQVNNRVNIIPQPTKVVERDGVFTITPQTVVYSDKLYLEVAALFANQAGLVASDARKAKASAKIQFLVADKSEGLDSTSYKLDITPEKVVVKATSRAGAMYGMSSLMQLMLLQPELGQLPCASIVDQPRFSYRGMHFDVSRNFFPVSFVKRFIDLMALYKMNYFHWHLTDGPGWRLEIKSYPLLTQKAAWRTHGTWKEWWGSPRHYMEEGSSNAYGGYYTQEQARDVVKYAAQRGITVIPEIEMPGHSDEVIAVYPNFSCSGEPYKSGEFCIGNEDTFKFLESVLTEVIDIFPSKYIHIGGDEANKAHWKTCPKCQALMKKEGMKSEDELQSYTIHRIEAFLIKHNRKLLGWDEILEGGLAPEATVMSWRGEQGGVDAAKMGHDVIMTPGGYCYFDSYQADPATQPLAIGGFVPIKKVYSYEPIPAALDASQAKHVLGAQGCIWTEYMPTQEHVEYMVFPRLLAMSEVVWSAKENRSWESFHKRLQSHYLMLQRLNVNYCRPSYKVDITPVFDYKAQKVHVQFISEQYQPTIHYTTDGTTPTISSKMYTGTFDVEGNTKVTAAVFHNGDLMGAPSTLDINFHKAIGKKIIYNLPYSSKYPAKGDSTLTNGYTGSVSYGDGQWQGFDSKDMDVTVDMGSEMPLTSLSANFMQQTGPGVYIPDSVVVSVSSDGKNFKKVGVALSTVPRSVETLAFQLFRIDLNGEKGRYVRLVAKNGTRGWLFADEIIVY